jgi:hypothetical protein
MKRFTVSIYPEDIMANYTTREIIELYGIKEIMRELYMNEVMKELDIDEVLDFIGDARISEYFKNKPNQEIA